MKTLSKYKELIARMPVEEQSFTTKRSTWEDKIEAGILDNIFEGKKTVKISRQDLFLKCTVEEFIYKVIMWGYPRGMRGHQNDVLIFKNLAEIIKTVNIPERQLFGEEDLENTFNQLFTIPGLGISTISKLLYFRTHKYGEFEALILDERLMRVFNNNIFEELSQLKGLRADNARKKYFDYLKVMHQTALQMNVAPANLEMFLFTFGNNL